MITITMREWETLTPEKPALNGLVLSDEAAMLAAQLSRDDRVKITELRHGLQIRSLSYVGRVTLGDLQITIQPKIETEKMLSLFRYAYGLRDLDVFSKTQYQADVGIFQELLIMQLVTDIQELLSRGLHRQYRRQSEVLSVPRGRMDMTKLARQGGVTSAELPCVYHPRSMDNSLNQVIRAGLAFALRLTSMQWLQVDIRRTLSLLDEHVMPVELSDARIKQAERAMDRTTRAYRSALILIRILYEGSGITLNASRNLESAGFLFDMNLFWERLLSRYLRSFLSDYEVQDQFVLRHMMRYIQGGDNRQAFSPRPDFAILEGGDVQTLLDAKYRDIHAKGLPRDMLYQLALYAVSLGREGTSAILYPTTDPNAIMEVIQVRDVLSVGELSAYVSLKPVIVAEFEQLIHHGTYREQIDYARYLAF